MTKEPSNAPYKLTVIMSNYNQAHLIGQAVDSVLMQETNFPFQLIITDDHSTKDNSVEIIKELAAKHPDKIKALLNEENARYLGNVLRAKANTRTPYFTLLDADDYWTDPHYLQAAVDYLEANPDVVIYERNVICRKPDGSESLFCGTVVSEGIYTKQDFFNYRAPVTQTSGAVFRNVIFAHGIPQFLTDAIGTCHEEPLNGDTFRFLMHLKEGPAYYSAKPSGVYNITPQGIWAGLSPVQQFALQGQLWVDTGEYYNEGMPTFASLAYHNLKRSINLLPAGNEQETNKAEEVITELSNMLAFCIKHRKHITEINERKPRPVKRWSYKLCMWLYLKLRKKLLSKNYIVE